MPSTSSGQNVEAATANASPTVVARPIGSTNQRRGKGTSTASTAATRKPCTTVESRR